MTSKISKKIFEEKKTVEKRLKFFNLEEHEHILNNIECNEKVNVEVLDKLIRSDLLKKQLHSPFADHYYESEREQLINYKKLINGSEALVKYSMKKAISYGRVIPKNGLGLFNIRRELRQTISKDYYVDIDVENCHPVILSQICYKNNIECKFLDEYINNRKNILEETMNKYNCNRDTAKRLYIRLMYFGTFKNWAKDSKIKNAEPTNFINDFAGELKEIGTEIFSCNKKLYNEILKDKIEIGKPEFNEIGSVVSYYLQEWEHRILEEVYIYLCDEELIINNDCVLCADGLMIKKEKYDSKLLKILPKLIKKKLNLNVIFTQKEMKEDYLDILESHLLNEQEYEKELLNGYDTIISDEILKNDFHIKTLEKFFKEDNEKMLKDYYPSQNTLKNKEVNTEYFHMSKSFKYFNHYHFIHYQSNTLYKIYDNKIESYNNIIESFSQLPNFGNSIIKNEHTKKHSNFEFNPKRNKESDKYNLFRGFKYDDESIMYDFDRIKHYLDHIKFMCCENEEATEYFINWMSHIIQKPNIKTEVAIVLFSHVEGVGKNIIWDIYAKLLEGYETRFRDTNSLTQKFNSDMMGKLFIIGDEIKARAQEVADELKDIITRRDEIVEFKGKDKFKVADFKNYAFTTNNENVFKTTKSDRRYFMVEAPEEVKNPEHYRKLIKLLNDDESLKHLHYYFKNRNIDSFEPRNIIVTDYKKRMIMEHIPAYLKFFIEKKYRMNYAYETKELYNDIIQYAKYNKLQSTFTETFFCRQIKTILNDYNELDKKTRRSVYIFDDLSHIDISNKINKFIFNNNK
jgi:hypothetical protein